MWFTSNVRIQDSRTHTTCDHIEQVKTKTCVMNIRPCLGLEKGVNNILVFTCGYAHFSILN